MFKRYLLISLLLISLSIFKPFDIISEDLIPDPLNYQEMPFTVLQYDVNLDLTKYAKREVTGICKITVARNEIYDGDYFIFHLNSLKISGITSGGKSLNFVPNGTEGSQLFHYRVDYPDNTTDTVEFEIKYSGVMSKEAGGNEAWGGVHYEETILYALGVGFYNPYVSTTRHWMPCFDLPQNKARYRGTFKVPSNFKVASNGFLNEVREVDGGNVEYIWVHDYPISTYSITFAAGPYNLIDNFDYKIPIMIFTLPTDSVASSFAYSEVPAMNDCYESLFGEFPFEKIGYTNVRRGAMEHQTMISMPRGTISQLYSKKNSNNGVAAHELSHAWFGNCITPIDFRHAWLNESFATYCESLWLRCRNGETDYLKNQKIKTDNYLNVVSKSEGIFALYDFPRELPSSNYPQTIYEKGAVVLGMLSWILDKKGYNFEDITKEYLRIFAYGNSQTNDFFRVMEAETDEDWSWFAEQWIYRAGWLMIDVVFDNQEIGRYSSDMEIRQVQEGELFENVPVEITFYLSDGRTVNTIVMISDEITDFRLEDVADNSIDSIKVNQGNIVSGLYQLRNIRTITSVAEIQNNKPEIYQDGDYLCINYESGNGLINASIVDLLGNSALQQFYQGNAGMNSVRFSLNSLPAGIYILNIMLDNQYYTHKISLVK